MTPRVPDSFSESQNIFPHGEPPAAAQPAKPLNYPNLKYTVPSDGPTGTCAICFRNFVPGQQVYRDNAPDSFRCLSHDPASSPGHQTILEQFDFSVAGVHLLDSPRPNYDAYDKAEWHTRGIKQGLKIARVILEEVLKAQAVAPAAALSPTKCVIGEYCQLHGFIHGAEAEELRERFEKLADDDRRNCKRSAIRRILDDVDARDSAAFISTPEGFKMSRDFQSAALSPSEEPEKLAIKSAFIEGFNTARDSDGTSAFEEWLHSAAKYELEASAPLSPDAGTKSAK